MQYEVIFCWNKLVGSFLCTLAGKQKVNKILMHVAKHDREAI